MSEIWRILIGVEAGSMRKLFGGAALIGGSLSGAAIASLVLLGPTLGVSPFGRSAPAEAPRTFSLPSGLSARAQLSRHNRAGALGAADGATLATGGISELPVVGGSATGGPTVLRPGGAARADATPGVSRQARQPFGGAVTGSGLGKPSNPGSGGKETGDGGGSP